MASQQLLEIAMKQCLDSQQPQVATGRQKGGTSEPATFWISSKHYRLINSSINRMLKESAAKAAACKFGVKTKPTWWTKWWKYFALCRCINLSTGDALWAQRGLWTIVTHNSFRYRSHSLGGLVSASCARRSRIHWFVRGRMAPTIQRPCRSYRGWWCWRASHALVAPLIWRFCEGYFAVQAIFRQRIETMCKTSDTQRWASVKFGYIWSCATLSEDIAPHSGSQYCFGFLPYRHSWSNTCYSQSLRLRDGRLGK